MGRAIANGAAFALSAVIGVVTSLVTAHPTTGLWAALGAAVAIGTGVNVYAATRESGSPPGKGQAVPLQAGLPPIDVAATDPAAVFSDVDVDRFTGRQWLADAVDDFMAENERGYFFVVADAGMGKTAFAAWLVKTRGYVSHFSRYAEGRSVRSALQNLSAQVLKSCGLEDQGLVPEWALRPGNFQSLLGKAAVGLGHGRRLVLVVDGLDEAEAVPDGMPFGLPMLLPPQVYVIATYRSGFAPRHPDPWEAVRIGPEDARNTGDIRAYLTAAAAGPELAGRLAAAGVSQDAFVDLLAERCQGIWVYLRYVLAEIRRGSRPLGSLGNVPAGLRNYYAEQLGRWRRDPAWADGLLPLLAALGCAEEPVTVAALAEFADHLDQAAVRRWCGTTLRPLLTVRTTGDEPLFEIYHASLREILRGSPPDSDGEPLENAFELREATIATHGRIADRYLGLFGGLGGGPSGMPGAGLARLVDDPALGQADGGYPLRHLAQHLQQANRSGDLFRLLRTEHAAGDARVVNVWYQAHELADHVARYLDDLTRAGGIVSEMTEQAVGRRDRAPTLGEEITFALMAASIASRTENMPATVVSCAVRAGLWSPARGLDHARRLPDPADRIQALLAIQPSLPAADRPGVLAEARTNATRILSPQGRIRALAWVAASLPPGQQAELFREALAIAATLDAPEQAAALSALAPRLPAQVRPEVLGLARAITHDYYRAQALGALVPVLEPSEQRQAVTEALAADRFVYDDGFRGDVVVALAPHLPADRLDESLAYAAALPDSRNRAAALTALAPRLADGDRARVVQQAREAAAAISYGTFRFEVLIALAALLPPDQQRDALRQALEGAATGYDGTRADLLVAMAPHLPADLLAEAVTVAGSIERKADRIRALAGLAGHLPEEQRPGVLRQALGAVEDDWLLDERALSVLVPQLPDDMLGEALDAAIAVPFDSFRARALSVLAPHLSAGQLARGVAAVVITDDFSRATVLTVLASHLDGDEQRAVQDVALDISFALTHHLDRSRALDRLLPTLHAGLRDRALALCRALPDEPERARALIALAASLSAGRRLAVLDEALEAARRVTAASTRASLLTALASWLPEDRRQEVTAEALDAVPGIGYAPSRADALAELGGLLIEDQFGRAVDLAAAIQDAPSRVGALTALADPTVSAPAGRRPGVLDQALAAAMVIDDGAVRVNALIELAPHLGIEERASALRCALDAALSDELMRYERLAVVAPVLPPPLLAEAAAAVAARKHGPDVRELAAVAQYLPAGRRQAALRQALKAAKPENSFGSSAEALTALAPHLPPDLLAEAVAIARSISSEADRAAALTAVGACLPADQQVPVFRDALHAISAIMYESTRDAALEALVAQLPADLLADALALVPESTAGPAVAVLTRASVILPADRIVDYVRLLRAALVGLDRVGCLSVIASAAGAISQIGGSVAVKACADAICDVDRWWP